MRLFRCLCLSCALHHAVIILKCLAEAVVLAANLFWLAAPQASGNLPASSTNGPARLDRGQRNILHHAGKCRSRNGAEPRGFRPLPTASGLLFSGASKRLGRC